MPPLVPRLAALLAGGLRRWRFPLTVLLSYVLSFFLLELFIRETIRYYVFSLCLIVSSLYFAWYLGGRRTLAYVGFFNLFFAFIFSRLLFISGSYIFAGQGYLGRIFFAMYVISLLLIVFMTQRQSPADLERLRKEESIMEEKRKRNQLELMVASEKLKQDLTLQANLVKDDLLLLQDAWRSEIHSIINDLPEVRERELYDQIVAPFQDSIIAHLRDLETKLSFRPEPVSLAELSGFLRGRLGSDKKTRLSRIHIETADAGWSDSPRRVVADRHKTWEILLNLIRNSQRALELKQIGLLKSDPVAYRAFKPRLAVAFSLDGDQAVMQVTDNGGGTSEDIAGRLFKEAVPSTKRSGGTLGQGSIFVKFFGESMGMAVTARNTRELGEPGLEVRVAIPLADAGQAAAGADAPRIR